MSFNDAAIVRQDRLSELERKAAAFDALSAEQKAHAARLALARECYQRTGSAEAWAELQGERRR